MQKDPSKICYHLSPEISHVSVPLLRKGVKKLLRPVNLQVGQVSLQLYPVILQLYPVNLQLYLFNLQLYPFNLQLHPLNLQLGQVNQLLHSIWQWSIWPRLGTGQDRVFCLCKQPDTGSWYIECPFCGDWYHSTCLQLTRRELEKLERFICPLCTQFNLPVPKPPQLEVNT